MSKRIVILVLLSCITLTGCVSKAEFDALEQRVSRLEQNSGYNNQPINTEQNTSVDQNSQVPLNKYIKNWDEVISVIKKEFGRSDLTIIEDTASMNNSQESASIKNFGKGRYYLLVDDTSVTVNINKNIAYVIYYRVGDGSKRAETPSYSEELEYGD